MTKNGAETKKEIRLAKKGNMHDLQQYRAKRFYKEDNLETIPFTAIVQKEQTMRELVQKEIYLIEKSKSQSSDNQELQNSSLNQAKTIGSVSGMD